MALSFDATTLTNLGFTPMEDHNPRYWISRTGKIRDTEKNEFLHPCRYRNCDYPSVVLQIRSTRRTYELPRLVYLYFVDPCLPNTTRIELKNDDVFDFSLENLRPVTVSDYKKSSRPKRSVDPDFTNWNETALYC